MLKTVVLISLSHPQLELSNNEVFVASGPTMKSDLKDIIANNPVQEIKCVNGFIPEEQEQSDLYDIMKPNSKLLITGIKTREQGQAIILDLKICGFVDNMAATDPVQGERFIVSKKPELAGSVAGIKLQTSSNTGVLQVKKWKMDLADLADEDLIDESELIDDIVIPEPADCGPGVGGKKRACANCSCGLAEIQAMEEAGETNQGEMPVAKSSCGSCYKGDAFRCASCPFLGKPAFVPGQEKVVLSMGMDDI